MSERQATQLTSEKHNLIMISSNLSLSEIYLINLCPRRRLRHKDDILVFAKESEQAVQRPDELQLGAQRAERRVQLKFRRNPRDHRLAARVVEIDF